MGKPPFAIPKGFRRGNARRAVLSLLILSACEGMRFNLVEFHRVHVVACTEKTARWPGDIWFTSKETGYLMPRRSRWREVGDRPHCSVWNRYTFWDLQLKTFVYKSERGEQYEAVEVMSMRQAAALEPASDGGNGSLQPKKD